MKPADDSLLSPSGLTPTALRRKSERTTASHHEGRSGGLVGRTSDTCATPQRPCPRSLSTESRTRTRRTALQRNPTIDINQRTVSAYSLMSAGRGSPGGAERRAPGWGAGALRRFACPWSTALSNACRARSSSRLDDREARLADPSAVPRRRRPQPRRARQPQGARVAATR